MPFEYYIIFLVLILLCAAFSGWASMRVHSAYSAFSTKKTASHMTGYDTAVRLLRANDIYDVSVGRVKGRLSDHFDPRRGVVNLSDATYGDDSVAAVAVAAHETGTWCKRREGIFPIKSVPLWFRSPISGRGWLCLWCSSDCCWIFS